VSNLLLFILLPTFPRVLGIFIFINASETNIMMQLLSKHFIVQEKYFYFILLHLDVAICIGAISLTATGTLFIGCYKHICGMFTIAR
jgi:hypothetical protein